ncbi:flagellar motor protein MotB [Lacihabitans sp. LS3-19]|uniref:OmpA family protein n=1 Tax=Lacihabitans sp. LS3-19 TaxID=2487335 RepID=UPI0020CEB771|nr:OmpA family protein [Lacihabitans sp. LS3-19]MCP9769663.1 flagellar motor protein MotB [Lacihabitans sp. LS3-19]
MFVRIKRKITLLTCAGLMSVMAIGQNALLKTAEHHFENLSFIKAIDAYEQALKKKGISDTDKFSAMKNLSESYLKVKDAVNAERVLRDMMSSSSDFSGDNSKVLLNYAQALASNGKYKESQEQYQKYLGIVDNDTRAKGFSKLYNDVSVLSKNAACYKVDYLSINTNAADFSPTSYQNGLIFVSNRRTTSGVRRVFNWNNTPFLDLYHLEDVAYLSATEAGLGGGGSSKKTKSGSGGMVGSDEYTMPTANDSRTIGTYGGKNISQGYGYSDKPITESDRMSGSINSKYHEGPAAFFKDGSKVLFTRNNVSSSGSAKKSSDGIIKLKLYMGEAKKDSWGNITELPFNSDEYSTGHPALSPDEKLLFFASDMPGGFGGTDIYVTRYDGTNWSAPVNLGNTINTKGNEMFPYVDEKGNLYFSSDGLPGLGELDIFFTQLDGVTQKGRVINLGAPINSSKDDFGVITDGLRQSGYFSSNRKRGGNDDDIYKFDRECELKEGCELLIAVYDAETKMPLDNTTINYVDELGNNIELVTNSEGIIALDNVAVDYEYTFKTTREGYSNNNVSYSTDECDNEPSRLEIPLERPSEADSLERITEIPASTKLGEDGTDINMDPNGVNGSNSSKSVPGLNDKTCIIRGKVTSQSNKKTLEGVVVTLRNGCDGSTVTALSDKNGNFQFTALEGCDYTIEGKKESMASKSKVLKKLNCKANENVSSDILMFTKGDVVEIENIYFDYGKCNIRSDARVELDRLVKLMRDYPKMKIELGSHTDSRSPSDFNQKLSEGRAKASADYLFKRGISRSRVEYKGYGETMLTNKCADGVQCTEQEHQANRRTEIKILQMD